MNTQKHIVVLTGAGISAESGLSTFRDSGGLWDNYAIEDVATPDAWRRNPGLVLEFYNVRRQAVRKAQPNAAHFALVELASHYPVDIITQNVDDLHERAGSTDVLHLHGVITKARSSVDERLIYELGGNDIKLGDVCAKGSQLRPHIVWFDESVPEFAKATQLVKKADALLIIGTSLSVYPAASLIDYAPDHCPIYVVAPDLNTVPDNIIWYREKAALQVPKLINHWLELGIAAPFPR